MTDTSSTHRNNNASPPKHEARDRLLSTAFDLFEERGCADFSLRELTSKAGTNLAAVNYHFGTKENLYIALLEKAEDDLSGPLRLIFDQAVAVEGTTEIKLRAYLTSLLAPLTGWGLSSKTSRLYFAMITKTWADCPALLAASLKSRSGHFTRHAEAIKTLLPQISQDELYWRLFFVLSIEYGVSTGAMHFLNVQEENPAQNDDLAFQRVLGFVVPGLLAKPSTNQR